MKKKNSNLLISVTRIIFSKQVIAIAICLVLTYFIATFVLRKKPLQEQVITEVQPLAVKTIVVEKIDKPIVIEAFGVIEADRELELSAEVGGRIVEISNQLVKGGVVKKGELLIQIDQRNFLIQVQEEKGNVESAVLELKLEGGKQKIAEKDWKNLSSTIRDELVNEELVLREPHLKEKETALVSAKSRLERAQIDLERTTVTAPFDLVVLEEKVEVGTNIHPNQVIANLVATDQFRVQLSVPLHLMEWVEFPDREEEEGSKVKIIQNLGSKTVVADGTILRLLGDLDPSGRMARVLVAIEDPLGLKESNRAKFPFLIGTYVEVQIEGRIVENVVIIPRVALREENTVWVKNANNHLEIRNVKVLHKYDQNILISEGLEKGDEVIISLVIFPIEGMELETVERGP